MQPHQEAPPGKIWKCAACGKTPRDYGWDESCMLNAVLVDTDLVERIQAVINTPVDSAEPCQECGAPMPHELKDCAPKLAYSAAPKLADSVVEVQERYSCPHCSGRAGEWHLSNCRLASQGWIKQPSE